MGFGSPIYIIRRHRLKTGMADGCSPRGWFAALAASHPAVIGKRKITFLAENERRLDIVGVHLRVSTQKHPAFAVDQSDLTEFIRGKKDSQSEKTPVKLRQLRPTQRESVRHIRKILENMPLHHRSQRNGTVEKSLHHGVGRVAGFRMK